MTENQNHSIDKTKNERGMLTGMFRDRESTENAYKTMQEKGYTKDEINIIM